MKGIGTPPTFPTIEHAWSGDGQWLSQDGFLFDPVRGLTFSVNPTAAFIHGMLADGLGIAAIGDAVVRRFEVDPIMARADLDDFLAELRDAGLQ